MVVVVGVVSNEGGTGMVVCAGGSCNLPCCCCCCCCFWCDHFCYCWGRRLCCRCCCSCPACSGRCWGRCFWCWHLCRGLGAHVAFVATSTLALLEVIVLPQQLLHMWDFMWCVSICVLFQLGHLCLIGCCVDPMNLLLDFHCRKQKKQNYKSMLIMISMHEGKAN